MTEATRDDTITETHDLQVTVIDGTLRLSGRDFDGTTLQVSPGVPVLVRVRDDANNYVYMTELPPRGARADSWGRNVDKGLARRMFDEVVSESTHVVFTIGKTSMALAYGPIIKIKPKGG
ncbi:hypothetical protein ACNOYE_37400 [Nannocystaceae bacterium ST9]